MKTIPGHDTAFIASATYKKDSQSKHTLFPVLNSTIKLISCKD